MVGVVGAPVINGDGRAVDGVRLLTADLLVLVASAFPYRNGDEDRLVCPTSGDAPASVSADSRELRDGERG